MNISHSYINGNIIETEKAKIPLLDRGLFLGDGLFETVKTENGKPIFWKEHYQRLLHSSEKLFFRKIPTESEIKHIIEELCIKSKSPSAMIRIIITRGNYEFNLDIKSNNPPNLWISLKSLSFKNEQIKPLSIKTVVQKYTPPLANIKTLNYLPQILTKYNIKKQGYDDALFIDSDQAILELTNSNFFCIIQDTIITPKLDPSILPGVTRTKILEIAKSLKWNIEDRQVFTNEIPNFQEAFSTSSIRGIHPIKKINDILINRELTTQTWLNKIKQVFTIWEKKDS